MTVRESPDELTLRAEEVDTLKAYVNVDHIEKERWVSHGEGIKGRNETRLALSEEHLKDPIVALRGEVRGRSVLKVSAQALGERCVPQ